MTINITFGGASINRPGAYSQVDTANMVPIQLGALKKLAVVGVVGAGASVVPGTVAYFNNAKAAALAIGDCALLEVMRVAWGHGADLIGVSAAAATALANPVAAPTLATATTGGFLPAATYYVTFSWVNANGETQVSPEANIVVPAGTATNTLTVTIPALPAGATSGNVYIGTAPGAGTKQGTTATTSLVQTAALVAGAAKPVANTASAPSDAQWQAAVDALQTEFVGGIIPVTTAAAIQAKVDTHITLMSSITNRRRRRGFYGHANGLAASAVAALSTPFADERAVLATPCPLVADSTGVKVAKPGYYMAAAFAGLWASQPEQEPITYKNVKFDGLETIYLGTDITTLLAAHVAPVEYVENVGFRIVQGITTSPSADLTKGELSVSTLKDVMNDSIERYFEGKYVGHAGVVGIEVTIYNDLVSMLEGFIKQGWISGYVPASVLVTKVGTAFTLDWEGKPTLPINNFLITSHFTL